MPRIPLKTEDFASAQPDHLDASWEDLLWSALTVGRPNLYHVFRHGDSSVYEAIFRCSLLKMALVAPTNADNFIQSRAFAALDPSEKGGVDYFLGMTLCHFFAARQLDTPFILHLDAYRNVLKPGFRSKERSRPDFVGLSDFGEWIAFESKGRIGYPGSGTRRKAKDQSRRIRTVNGRLVTQCYATISHFSSQVLSLYVRDPEPVPKGDPAAIELEGDPEAIFRLHYSLVMALASREQASRGASGEFHSELVDATLDIHPRIKDLILRERWDEIARLVRHLGRETGAEGYRADGIKITCGPSWYESVRREGTHEVGDE